MPKYILNFENQGYEIGGSYPDDSVVLELTETEEHDLINLIRQKNSSDLYTLNLWENLPEVAQKIYDVWLPLAKAGTKYKSNEQCYDFWEFIDDRLEFLRYCRDKWGYVLQSDKEDFIYDGEFEEDDYLSHEIEMYPFDEWVRDLLNKLNYEDWYKFVTEAFGFDFDPHPAYWPKLPKEIIEKSGICNK